MMDDAQIFISLKNGDKEAFNLLFDQLYEPVCVFAVQITKDGLEAEDIGIHALAKFWEKGIDGFETFAEVKAFIFAVARNAAYNFLKKEKREKKRHHQFVYTTSGEIEQSIAEQAEIAMYKVELLRALTEEIDRLPEQCREAFKLVFIDNLPRPLVAERLNISLNTVHSHCANAKNRLKQIISEKELIILLLIISACPN